MYLYTSTYDLVFAIAGFEGDDYPQQWNIGKLPDVALDYGETSHFQVEGPIADAEWAQLFPGDGMIHLGEHGRPFSLSLFHQLRCLDIVRRETERMGNTQKGGGEFTPTTLVAHCVNYVRQMVLCRGNRFLDPVVGVPTLHVLHERTRCRDWEKVYSEVEKLQQNI
ncbi:hypothetical protein BDP27DRAFT_1357793 [Rhodocollybia butyracea]|uniref:Uncharacterized protein n=1 Tax=Rhodocollybia butyracea TaxID=206335 RepID=A0A9P5QA07_9AGAR|nr:hypothetical protein BDP27DRAFT_1357793 [Rhodocollybia butyracea]